MSAEPLVMRPFSIEQDITPVLALYAAVEKHDQLELDTSEQSLRRQLEQAGHDPAKDRWVMEARGDPSMVVGTALVKLTPGATALDANITVHPEWRRRGIGSQLLARVIERAGELNAGAIQVYANAKHAPASDFLNKHGFVAQGAYTEMRLEPGRRLPPVIWPFGYSMRPYAEVQNLATLTEAMNQSYIPLWGHNEVSEEEMASWLPDFCQESLFLVFSEKGRVVGISRVEASAERTAKNGFPTGYIDAPGVVPQHRRLDLYRALVLTGIHWLEEHGQSMVEMESWGDKLEVLKMYGELGFKDLRQLVSYRLNLLPQGSALSGVSP